MLNQFFQWSYISDTEPILAFLFFKIKQVQSSNRPPVLRLTSQTSKK